jgi:hypothetical protein
MNVFYALGLGKSEECLVKFWFPNAKCQKDNYHTVKQENEKNYHHQRMHCLLKHKILQFVFFLIVVFPCMLTITQLLFQQNAFIVYY